MTLARFFLAPAESKNAAAPNATMMSVGMRPSAAGLRDGREDDALVDPANARRQARVRVVKDSLRTHAPGGRASS